MTIERTMALIKPDAVQGRLVGNVIGEIETMGEIEIVAARVVALDAASWGHFYMEHVSRPFYQELCAFMASGRVIALVLEGTDAIARWRRCVGGADANHAEVGTIREMWGSRETICRNVVHGSDSATAAQREIDLFFPALAGAGAIGIVVTETDEARTIEGVNLAARMARRLVRDGKMGSVLVGREGATRVMVVRDGLAPVPREAP